MSSALVGKWLDIGPVTQIEPGSARTLPVAGGEEIAVFRTMQGDCYALVNKCPHKQGPLSQGLLHGSVVTCPLHNWNISLKTGEALGDDVGCVPTIPMRVDAGRMILLREAVIGGGVIAAEETAGVDSTSSQAVRAA